ncbi:MAG: hypothetical protein FWD49_02590 [Firmicutes bacterium]|nr:hypothetical protein [Bacillota bacterium]
MIKTVGHKELMRRAEERDSQACFELGQLCETAEDLEHRKLALTYYNLGMNIDMNPYCLYAKGEAHLFGEIAEEDEVLADGCFVTALEGFQEILEKNKDDFSKIDPYIYLFIGGCFFRSKTLHNLQDAYNWFKLCHDLTDYENAQKMADLSSGLMGMQKCQAEMDRLKKEIAVLEARETRRQEEVARAQAEYANACRELSEARSGMINAGITRAVKTVGGVFGALLNVAGVSSGDTFSSSGNSFEKTYNTSVQNQARIVQEGVHRYIVTNSGNRISVSEYDAVSGIAKGSDGKTYRISGSISDREIKHN